MASLDPSIRHAISPPEFGEDKLHRAELVDRLHGEIPKSLVAIAAPAGYGKTTFLADFAAHTDVPVVWARVSEVDRDPMRFASLLLSALEKRFRRLRGSFDLQTYAGSRPQELAFGFINLIEEHIPESFFLILDDVHLIHDSNAVMEFLDELVLNMPEQTTLVASGREVLEVSLARLMAEDDLAGFGPHDLSLGWEETSELLSLLSGQELSPIEVSRVQEFTRGWVTGVVLSEYSATQATLESGISESLIYEYLSSVVINRQPEYLRRFMLDASVLPIMTVETCNAVLNRDDSEICLNELVSRNLFISVSDDTNRTYEFHPIFRTQLNEALKASDHNLHRELRQRAAHYLLDAAPEISFKLYLEIGDQLQAADIAEDYADELYQLGRYSTIESWSDQLEEVYSRAPKLAYYRGLIFMNRGSLDQALEIFDQIIQASSSQETAAYSRIEKGQILLRLGNYSELDKLMAELDEMRNSLTDARAQAQVLRLDASILSSRKGDHIAAGELLNDAVELLSDTGHRSLLLGVLQDQTYYFGISGEINRTRIAATKSLELAQSYSSPVNQIASYLNIGQIDYLDGKFHEALLSLEAAKSLAAKTSSSEREAEVLIYQADIFNDVGLAVQAGDLYQQGLNIAAKKGLNRLLSYGSIGVSLLQRRAGNFRLANEWLKRASEFEIKKDAISPVIQKAAIILESNPNEAIRVLSDRNLKDLDSSPASDRTLREYLLAKANHLAANYSDAAERFESCLHLCSILSTYQYLAAEIFADNGFYEQISRTSKDDVLFEPLDRQIELIRAFHSHYSTESNEETGETLLVKALGEATIQWKGQNINDLKPQAVELLLMLVDMGSVDRDRFIEVFWPEHPPGRQTGNLHMAVYSIRRALGKESVILRGTTYELDPSMPLQYDVADFERAIEVYQSLPPGDPRSLFALTEANNNYGGSFLPDFYSDWVENRRRRLELAFLDIASEYADLSISREQPIKALSSLRDALNIDPYRDDLNEKYLEALLELGRRSDVISHFQAYSKMLEDDLGLQPTDRISRLYDRAMGAN